MKGQIIAFGSIMLGGGLLAFWKASILPSGRRGDAIRRGCMVTTAAIGAFVSLATPLVGFVIFSLAFLQALVAMLIGVSAKMNELKARRIIEGIKK